MLVMILDSNLNYLSSRCIGTVFQEEGWSIVEHFGYIYASGITMAAMPSGDINSLKGLSDGFIAKLDLMGNLVWLKHTEVHKMIMVYILKK